MEVKKYPYIDSLRGFAILSVLLMHSGGAAVPTNKVLSWCMEHGARGVQFFFITSAITLFMSWDARVATEKFPKLDFYLLRFFRIAPMFYLAIVLYLLVDGFAQRYYAPNGLEGWMVLSTAFFLHGLHPEAINSVIPGGWSIAVEMTFYLFFPIIAMHVRSYSALTALFVASLVFLHGSYWIVPLIIHYPESQQYLLGSYSFLNFFGQFPVFLVGIYAYFFIKNGFDKQTFYLVGTCLFIAMCLEYYSPKITQPFMPYYVVGSIAFALFATFLSVNPVRIFVNPVTVYLGKVSYSAYLLHFAVLKLLEKIGITANLTNSNIGSISHFFLLVLLTVAVSTLTLKWVEKPGIKLGNWVIGSFNKKLARSSRV